MRSPRTPVRGLIYTENFKLCLLTLFALRAEDGIDNDAEDQGTGYFRNGNGAEIQGKTADTADQNYGYGEEVTIIIQIGFLDHLQTTDSNEPIQGNADTTHDTGRDRS